MSLRKTKFFLCLGLIAILVFLSVSSVFAYSKELVITPVKQAKTNWCWAASADMAANWIYGDSGGRDQYAIVNHVKGWLLNPYPNVGGSLTDSKNGSEYVCHDDSYYVFKYSSTPFTISQIRTAITNSYPIQACVGYYSNNTRTGGHMLVICGADYTDSKLQYIDPWDATSHWVTLSSFQNGLLATGSKYDGEVFLDGPDTIQIAYSGDSLTNTGGDSTVKGLKTLKVDNSSLVKNLTGTVTVDSLGVVDKNTNTSDLEALANSEVKNIIINVCESSKDKIFEYTDKVAKSVKLDNAIKLYYLNTTDILDSYKNGLPVGSLISNNFEWRIPVADINGNINYELSIKNDDQKETEWDISDIGEIDKTIGYQFNNNEIKRILIEQGFEKAKNLKFISTGRYHINILYFTQNNTEYGLPLNTRMDLIDLNNGTVYKMSEIVNALDKAFISTNEN